MSEAGGHLPEIGTGASGRGLGPSQGIFCLRTLLSYNILGFRPWHMSREAAGLCSLTKMSSEQVSGLS